MMTIVAIFVGALLLVLAAIFLVLRVRCYRAKKRKRHKEDRESNGSSASKAENNVRASCDGDEKNPDIIPQSGKGKMSSSNNLIKK